MLGKPDVKILDCSVQMGRKEGDCSRLVYHQGHIKGAQFLDLENLKDHKSNLPLMMPNEKFFIDAMKRLCIKLSDTVVCYETGGMQLFGYRAAWMLEAMGHPNVRILDGGFKKWKAEGKPIEVTDGRAAESDYSYAIVEKRRRNLEDVKNFE